MDHKYCADYVNVRLRPLKECDIENLRVWRNDREATKYLRNVGTITPEMQKAWFENYLKSPDVLTFAIVETKDLNRMVGSVALYDIAGDVAEIGKIQVGDPEAHGKGIGRLATVLAMWIGFRELGLKKIIASVHQENIPAHRNDMKMGFRIVGSHPSHVGGFEDEIEIDEARLIEVNPYVSEVRLHTCEGEGK